MGSSLSCTRRLKLPWPLELGHAYKREAGEPLEGTTTQTQSTQPKLDTLSPKIMARLTVAAGLAWVTLLMCVALGAAQRGDLLATLFPTGSLPPPVRIYCKMNPGLNMAVRNGRVVLVPDDCSDLSQVRLLS